MTAAAGPRRYGGVTVAAREAVTMAGLCQAGDVLGIVDGDVVVIGDDLADVGRRVLDRMLAAGGELVTLVPAPTPTTGAGRPRSARHLRREPPGGRDVAYDGGQPRYPLLLGVE